MKLTTKIKAERMLKHLENNKIYDDEVEDETLIKINRLEGKFVEEIDEAVLAEIYDEIHGEVKK